MEDLKLIVLDNIEELGKKIDNNLKKIYKTLVVKNIAYVSE